MTVKNKALEGKKDLFEPKEEKVYTIWLRYTKYTPWIQRPWLA